MMTAASTRTPTPLPFNWQLRADLFTQLATMEKSGLSAVHALNLLRMPSAYQPRVAMTSKWLGRGFDLSVSGYRSGLFTELEANLVSAASNAGSPASTFERLAKYYRQRANQARAIKARLALPGIVFVIGLFVQPLPALVHGTLGPGAYLLHSLSPLAAVVLLAFLWRSVRKVIESRSSPMQTSLDRIAMAMPLIGKVLIRRNIRDFFEMLVLMLEAGVPILQALPKALDTMQLGAVKSAFGCIQPRIEQGNTLTQALTDISYVDSERALALIETGEASGSLPEMLFRYADMETNTINNFDKQVADWLPRIIYAAVAGWLAYGILGGSAMIAMAQ